MIRTEQHLIGKRTIPMLFLTTLLIAALGLLNPAQAVVAPLAGACKIEASMPQENLANIVFEEFNGTLTIKNLVWNGTAVFYSKYTGYDGDGEDDKTPRKPRHMGDPPRCEEPEWLELMTANVKVSGIILTQGTRDAFADKPGILQLAYSFTDSAGAPLGTATGFAPLEAIWDLWGSASFQGLVSIDGVALTFVGTGQLELPDFISYADYQKEVDEILAEKQAALDELQAQYDEQLAALQEEYADDPAGLEAAKAELDAWYQQEKAWIEEEYQGWLDELRDESADQTMRVVMDDMVMTPDKPGFVFEGAKRLVQVNRLFTVASKKLVKERNERLRVLLKIKK